MIFSKTCEYAIRAVIFISQKSSEGRRVGIKEIAAGIDSPEHFIAKILQDLSRKGLVQSVKGPNGGFTMDGISNQINLEDVVKAVDGDALFTGCGLGLKNCSEKQPCPLHDEFKAIRKKIQLTLRAATVGEFNEELDRGLSYIRR